MKPNVRQTFVAPVFAAPDRADVDAAEEAREPVPERQAADHVASGDEVGVSTRLELGARAYGRIWYLAAQSFTTPQSRLSKNASM